MPALLKSCPECNTNVHARKSMCDCGYSFALKCRTSSDTVRKSMRIAMKTKRALETDDARYRKDQNAANVAKKRVIESSKETMHRREHNRTNMAKKRALESPSETESRQELNRTNMAKKEHLKAQVKLSVGKS